MRQNTREKEYEARYFSGWAALASLAAIGVVALALFLGVGQSPYHRPNPLLFLVLPALVFLAKGFVITPPNIAVVFTFFGDYAGSLNEAGFFWTNPFYKRERISLRIHNQATQKLKVNDRSGNPVEVGAIIVWRVTDTARAAFDVEDYATYVAVQSESALRTIVSDRWYDGDKDGGNSLRGDVSTVAAELGQLLGQFVTRAGVEILEARIAHLAYAPEIASAMLRRQQAEAVVAARRHIVDGAVGMVKLAIDKLEDEKIVQLDSAGKARLVSNLMTVLVGDGEATPVLSVDG